MTDKTNLPLDGDPHLIANALFRTFETWLEKQDIAIRNANMYDFKKFYTEFGVPDEFSKEVFEGYDKRDLEKRTLPHDNWDGIFYGLATVLTSKKGVPYLQKKAVRATKSGGSMFSIWQEKTDASIEMEDTTIKADSITIKTNSETAAEIKAEGKISIKGDVEIGAKLKTKKPFKLVDITIEKTDHYTRRAEVAYEEKGDPELKKFELEFPHVMREDKGNYVPTFKGDLDTGRVDGDAIMNWLMDKHYAASMGEHYDKDGNDLTRVMIKSDGVWKRWNIPANTNCPLVYWKTYPSNGRWRFRGEWNIGQYNEMGLKHIINDGYIQPLPRIPLGYENLAWHNLERLTEESMSFAEDEMRKFSVEDFFETKDGLPIKPLQYEIRRQKDGFVASIVYGSLLKGNKKPAQYRELCHNMGFNGFLYGRLKVWSDPWSFAEADDLFQNVPEELEYLDTKQLATKYMLPYNSGLLPEQKGME